MFNKLWDTMVKIKQKTHTQCKLRRFDQEKCNWEYYTAYIPTEWLTKGESLRLCFDGEWQDGWTIEEAYTQLPSTVVMERERDYKKTRKASDI